MYSVCTAFAFQESGFPRVSEILARLSSRSLEEQGEKEESGGIVQGLQEALLRAGQEEEEEREKQRKEKEKTFRNFG